MASETEDDSRIDPAITKVMGGMFLTGTVNLLDILFRLAHKLCSKGLRYRHGSVPRFLIPQNSKAPIRRF